MLDELKQTASRLTGAINIILCSCPCLSIVVLFLGLADDLYQRETQERVSLKVKELSHISNEQKSTSQVK